MLLSSENSWTGKFLESESYIRHIWILELAIYMNSSKLWKNKIIAKSKEMWLVTFPQLNVWLWIIGDTGKSLRSYMRWLLVKSHEKKTGPMFCRQWTVDIKPDNESRCLKIGWNKSFWWGMNQYFKDRSLSRCLCYLVVAFIHYCNWIIKNIDFYLQKSLCNALDLQKQTMHDSLPQKANLKRDTVICQ